MNKLFFLSFLIFFSGAQAGRVVKKYSKHHYEAQKMRADRILKRSFAGRMHKVYRRILNEFKDYENHLEEDLNRAQDFLFMSGCYSRFKTLIGTCKWHLNEKEETEVFGPDSSDSDYVPDDYYFSELESEGEYDEYLESDEESDSDDSDSSEETDSENE